MIASLFAIKLYLSKAGILKGRWYDNVLEAAIVIAPIESARRKVRVVPGRSVIGVERYADGCR